jgi:hypothetical protein
MSATFKIEVLHAKSQKKIGDFEINKTSTILDVKKAIAAKSKILTNKQKNGIL